MTVDKFTGREKQSTDQRLVKYTSCILYNFVYLFLTMTFLGILVTVKCNYYCLIIIFEKSYNFVIELEVKFWKK